MKEILICEGGEILFTALEFRLRKHGLEIKWAKTKKEALLKVEEKIPDLIVGSLDMPGWKGKELLDIAAEYTAAKIPVILIGDMEEEVEILDALKSGAADFLIRPFKPSELAIRIIHILDHQS